ncbi:hypothetical protein GX888_03665, partial [Candidatus Dojkabacteria bacterium]|nr:hypothetical protein [Candidatus Dojkabacteria bacterium]
NRNQDNYDVIGGIFDFIFGEAKKQPEKRKRIIPEKEYVSAPGNEAVVEDILTVLSAPGVFISSTAPKEVWDALETDLINIPIDEFGGFKITTSNITKLFKDPKGFVNAAHKRAKSIRNAQAALYLGGTLSSFMTTAWARDFGNKEVLKASLGSMVADKRGESYKIARALGQYVESKDDLLGSGVKKPPLAFGQDVFRIKHETHLDFMAERASDLLGRGTFGKEGWKNLDSRDKTEFVRILSGELDPLDQLAERVVGSRYKTMDLQQRNQERRKLSSLADRDNVDKEGFAKAEIQRYLANRYGVEVAKKFGKVTRGSKIPKEAGSISITNKQFKEHDTINIFDPSLYRSLERNNLVEEINTSTGENRALYERTLIMLESNRNAISDKLTSLRKELASTTDPKRKGELKLEMKQVRRLSNVLGTNTFIGKVGQWEGYLASVKSVWAGEGVNPLKSIWDQSFFDNRKNKILNPVLNTKLGEVGKKVDFVVAKRFAGKDMLNAYNEIGETLYYANPKTWVRTLVTGEGFAWLTHKRVESVKGMLGGIDKPEEIIGLLDDLFKNGALVDLEKNIEMVMKKIELKNINKTLTPEQLAKIESLLKSTKTLRGLTDTFSKIARLQKQVAKMILEKTKELRRMIVRKIMQNKVLREWIIKHGASKLLGQFVVKGSVKTLIQGIASSIAGAIGLTGGPAAILTFAITWVATEVIWVVGKLTIRIGTAIVKFQTQLLYILFLGIIGLVLVVVSSASNSVAKFNNQNYSYSNASPGSVVVCNAYDYGIGEPELFDCDANCVPNLPVPEVPCLNVPETIRLAKIWTGKSEAESTSNVERCLGDVVRRALNSGADPIFTIAIWIHESAASDYCSFDYPIEDWGIHGRADVPKNDFNAQITYWLPYPNIVRSMCPNHSLRNFISYYWFGTCEPADSFQESEIDRYIRELEFIYSIINSCTQSLPTWPQGGDSPGIPGEPYPPVPIGVSCGPDETYEDAFEKAKQHMISTYGHLSKMDISNMKLVWSELTDNCRYYCHAMTSGQVTCDPCLIEKGTSCDYFIRLSVHELTHWMSACGGGEKMREWGAEYISNNAGGYNFTLNSTKECVKATEIGPTVSKCKALGRQGMIYASFCKPGTDWKSCFDDVEDQMEIGCK